MDRNYAKNFRQFKAEAECDPQYQQMLMECRRREQRFLQMEQDLEPEQRDVIWDYLMICEDMNELLLKIAFQKWTEHK